MAGDRDRRAQGEAVAAHTAPQSHGDLFSLEDLLAAPVLLPDECGDESAQLRAAILADLAPRGAYEQILAANLVELELEQRRLRRWIATAIRAQLRRRLPGGGTDRIAADLASAAPERRTRARAACAEAGVDLEALVVRIRLELDDQLARLEADLREIERRRRALFGDLDALRRSRGGRQGARGRTHRPGQERPDRGEDSGRYRPANAPQSGRAGGRGCGQDPGRGRAHRRSAARCRCGRLRPWRPPARHAPTAPMPRAAPARAAPPDGRARRPTPPAMA